MRGRWSPWVGGTAENGWVMKRVLGIAVGLLLTVIGVVWTLQGLGYLEGSSMTGEAFWAIVGPIVAGMGVALLYVVGRGAIGRRG